jgi:hypothetical protein
MAASRYVSEVIHNSKEILNTLIQVVGHEATDAEHLCQARVHECGEVRRSTHKLEHT